MAGANVTWMVVSWGKKGTYGMQAIKLAPIEERPERPERRRI